MKFDHVNISAPKSLLEKDKIFLCTVFNLKEGFRPKLSFFGYWLYSGEQAIIHLSESNNHCVSDKPFYLDHVAFQMEGLSTFIALLTKHKITYQKKYQEETRLTQIFLNTPSGVKFEVGFKNEPFD